MLTLTRKSGEAIMIGDDIRIVIHEIRGSQAKISIEAPNSVLIYREEIYLKKQGEKEQNQDQDPNPEPSTLVAL